jgi:hypothetical protein
MTEPFASLFHLIEPLERGECDAAQSIYVTTGESPPLVSTIKTELEKTGLAIPDFQWLGWIDEARPYLQTPEKLEHASLEEVKKLVTLAVHADQFNASFLAYLCASGFILSLIRRIRALCA